MNWFPYNQGRSFYLALPLSVLLPFIARGETPTQYFCAVEASTGFYFENGEWGVANFKNRQKYLLKEADAKLSGPDWAVGDKVWELLEVGSSSPIATCSDWWTDVTGMKRRSGRIECSGLYKMQLKTPWEIRVAFLCHQVTWNFCPRGRSYGCRRFG